MSCLLVILIDCQKGHMCSEKLKSKVSQLISQSISQSVTEWQGHLFSCLEQLKTLPRQNLHPTVVNTFLSTMFVEEGTFIAFHKAELLKSKSERHKAIVMRTTTQVVQGGAEPCRGSKEEDIEKSYIGRWQTGGGGGEGVGGAEEGEQSLGPGHYCCCASCRWNSSFWYRTESVHDNILLWQFKWPGSLRSKQFPINSPFSNKFIQISQLMNGSKTGWSPSRLSSLSI